MRVTKILCPYCNKQLVDVAGYGQEKQYLICNNPSCPSHFKHIKCPKCESIDKHIRIIGLGHQIFKCKNCENKWSSFDD